MTAQQSILTHILASHNTSFALAGLILTLVMGVVVMVLTIMEPGLTYCPNEQDKICSGLKPDWHVDVVIASIPTFVLCIIFTSVFIFAPGYHMENPYRTKTLSLVSVLVAIFALTLGVFSALVWRDYAIPMNRLIPNAITVTPIDSTSAKMTTTNLFLAVIDKAWSDDDRRLMPRVYEGEEHWDNFRHIPPTADVHFRVEDWDDAIEYSTNVTLSAVVSDLVPGNYYLFTVIPAMEVNGGAVPAYNHFHWTAENLASKSRGAWIDIRLSFLCLWSPKGCVAV